MKTGETRKRISLSARILVYWLGAALAVSVILLSFLVYQTRTMTEKNIKTQADLTMRYLRADILNSLEPLIAMVDQAAALARHSPSAAALEPLLASMVAVNPGTYDLYYAAVVSRFERGGFFASGTGWVPGENWNPAGRPWFSTARQYEGKTVFSDPYYEEGNEKMMTTISKTAAGAGGEVIGVAAADVYVDVLEDMVSSRRITGDGQTVMIDADGLYLTHPDREKIMTGNIFDDLKISREDIIGGDFQVRIAGGEYLCSAPLPFLGVQWYLVSRGSVAELTEGFRPVLTFISLIVALIVLAAAALAVKNLASKNVIPVVFIIAFAVVFGATIAAHIFAAFLIRAMEFNISQRMMVSASRAADLVSAEELDQYREIEDMRQPSYQALRRRLREFSDSSGLLYVYYIRPVDGALQYVVDNDFNEATRVGLDTPPVDTLPWMERALKGNTASSELGNYLSGWDGILSAFAPVFDREGKVAYLAGADIEDKEIVFARRMVDILTVIQVIAVIAVFVSVLIFLIRFQAMRDSSAPITQNSIQRKFFAFSCVFFLLLCAAGAVVFAASLRRLGEDRLGKDLSLAVESMRLNIAKTVEAELWLSVKMADTPIIKKFFRDPGNAGLREQAFEELEAYRRNFRSGSIFWVNDVDKILYYDGVPSYTVDPAHPSDYWYNISLYETERYNFNINSNSALGTTNLWVNVPVMDEGKPVGILGAGIDLSGFIDFTNHYLDAGMDFYGFNTIGEITAAKDPSLVFAKKNIAGHLGEAGEAIAEAAKRTNAQTIQIVNADNVKYAVSSIPMMGWFVAVSGSASVDIRSDSGLLITFSGIALLVLVIFIVSNVFVASIQATVDAQNRRLLELAEEARSASRAKSSFLAATSHEIRTPMNAIIGMSELALRETTARQKDGCLREIQQAGHNLLSIINDILDFSKIESGKLDITEREYALSSLLGDCASIISTRLGEKPLRFITEFDPALPNKVMGDEARVRQVTLNLLSNAVKYTPAGTVTFSVSGEKLSETRINLIIKVADTGIGLKPEDMPKLFGEFNRLDSAKNRCVEGTGLGLAISRNLCWLMGGDITVESEYGAGSVFTACIPQTVTDAFPFTIEDRKKSAASFSFRFTAKDARILLVDDLPANITVAAGLLAPYQMTIDTAFSGEEAVKLAQSNRYDLVLMDHMMPGMDGVEAAARIRALEGDYYKTLPIIALTANAMSGMKEMFLEKDFDDYLSKPIDIPKLDGVLARWIPKDKQQKAGAPAAEERQGGADTGENFVIPGLDVPRGLAMTGGTAGGYRKVLAMFRKDAMERLALLQSPPEAKDLPLFITQVHALKGAAASIGAADIPEEAALLEAAGKGALAGSAEDMAAIRNGLGAFAEHLSALAEEIGKAIQNEEETGGGSVSGDTRAVALQKILNELASALEAQRAEAIDRVLEELLHLEVGAATKEVLEQISDDVLMVEYGKALERIRDLTKEATL